MISAVLSQLDVQGSVFDETGASEMLSARAIVLKGREGIRVPKQKNDRDHRLLFLWGQAAHNEGKVKGDLEV